jgi:hypothetical protein
VSTIIYWQDEDGVTEHPVEEGVNVADHVRPEQPRLTIEAIVSNIPNPRIDTDLVDEPIELEASVSQDAGTRQITLDVASPPITPSVTGLVRAGVGALGTALFGGPKATVQQDRRFVTKRGSVKVQRQRSPRDRRRDVYELLQKAHGRGLVCVVSTAMRDYFDMVLERVSAPRSVDGGKKVTFSIDLKRIRVVSSETVAAPRPAEERALGAKNRGSQGAKPDSASKSGGKLKSMAAVAADGFEF